MSPPFFQLATVKGSMMGKDVVDAPAGGNRYLVLVGAIIVQLILGTVYGYSIFWPPLQAEVYPPVIAETNVVTWDEMSDRVITSAEAEAMVEADESTEGYIIVPDEESAQKRKQAIGQRKPVSGFLVYDSRGDVKAALAKARGGELVEGHRIVADAAAVDARKAKEAGYLKYAFSICILSFAIAMVIAGRVQDVKGPRFPAVIGAILMGLGFLVAGFMRSPVVLFIAHAALSGAVALVLLMLYHALFGKVDTEKMPALKYLPFGIVTMVIVAAVAVGQRFVGADAQVDRVLLLWGTIGFLAGVGIGFAYVCPIAALVKWFPDKKGLVAGIAVAGFGFGAYVFSQSWIPFSAENYIKANGVVNLFLIHGVVCLVGVIIGAMLLRNPPGVVSTKAAAVADSHWQDTLKRPSFYVLWLMFFSGAMAGLMVIGILKGFAGEQLVDAAKATDAKGWIASALAAARGSLEGGFDEWRAGFDTDAQAARQWIFNKGVSAVGWLAIFNALGRIVWGFVSDWIGRTLAFVAMFSFQAVMLFVLGMLNTELTLAVGASIIGFNFGGNFALFPSATADLFGAKNLGANYGWVFTSYGVAGVVGIAAGNMAKEQTGSYFAAFALAAALCLVSAVLAVGLKVMDKKPREAVAVAPAAAGGE